MERIKELENMLGLDQEVVLFATTNAKSYEGRPFGIALYNSREIQPVDLDDYDCEYGASLEEAIDKAIKRWG